MYLLQLNDMRSSKIEHTQPIAVAETVEELESFMQKHEHSWTDGQWQKSFAQNSPLEWFNKPFGIHDGIIDIGTAEDAARRFNEFIEPLLIKNMEI